MKYLLKTSYPCLVKTEAQSEELEENDLLEIEDEKYLFVYPENPRQTPFYINLTSPRENEFYSIIKSKGEKIIFLEPIKRLQVEAKESLSISGQTCDVRINDNYMTFENGTKKITYMCPHICRDYKVFKVKNFVCVQFKNDFYAFNCHKNKLSHIQGDELNFDTDKLVVIRKFNDSFGRERKATYKFEEDINMQDEEFTKNSEFASAELVPYRLLESVKAKDFSCALTFLSDNLKKNIDEEKLRQFFGNINSFLPLSTTEFITLCEKQKNFVKFEIQNDKIDDILIDAL